MAKLNLYYGTVKSATGGRHVMAWAESREHALDLVEAALTANEPVLGSVVGPLMSVRDDVMKPGVFVEVTPGRRALEGSGTGPAGCRLPRGGLDATERMPQLINIHAS